MEISPEQFSQWMSVLGKPTLAVIIVFVAVWYRDTVQHFFKTVIDIIGSWLKRHGT